MSIVVEIAERRRALRADVRLEACVSELGEQGLFPGDDEMFIPLYGRILNLSALGLLMEANQPICPGREVEVFFRIGERRVCIRGRVRRASMLSEDRSVLAVEFKGLEPRARKLLTRIVKSHSPEPVLN